ncbi:conjugal transfer protein TrbB [Mycobacterium sp. smrl_JER01]|uniref:conjugal transfer protein TrbB n=1 Tax=Mycobacterium sp. smrl_JER01 TaxID=3402633 RepID=UPI003AD5F620
MVLHVTRDRTGRRRLGEVGVLQRGHDGTVSVLTSWHRDTGAGPGAGRLRELVRSRSRT